MDRVHWGRGGLWIAILTTVAAACESTASHTTTIQSGGAAGGDGSLGSGGAASGRGGSSGTVGGGASGSGGTSGAVGQAGQGAQAGAAGTPAEGGPGCDGGLTACGTECASLDTSSRHCGRCNHDCLGGTCELGHCQPVTITTGQYNPSSIAVDATHVYWGRGATSQSSPVVSRVRIDGTGGVRMLQQNETGYGLTVANNQIYWMFNGAVRTCPAPECIGGASNLASSTGTTSGDVLVAQSVNRIYFGEPSVYNTSTGALWYVPLLGGSAQKVAGAPTNPAEIESDGTTLYWANSSTYFNDITQADGRVLRMPLAGGAVVSLVDTITGDIGEIAVAAGAIYLAGNLRIGTQYQQGVYKVPLPNGVGSAAPPLFAAASVPGLIADADNVYFTAGNSVHRCPHSGCTTPPEVIAPGQENANDMTQDAVSIYWVTYGSVGVPASAAVRRLAK